MTIYEFLRKNQQAAAVLVGYAAAAGLGFGLGQMTARSGEQPEIQVEQAFAPLNDTPISADNQPNNPAPTPVDKCAGQIKGNIGSSGRIYHVSGSSSYNRTDPEECFATEDEAQAAGFRKAGSR